MEAVVGTPSDLSIDNDAESSCIEVLAEPESSDL